MRLCRYETTPGQARIGLTTDGSTILDLTAAGVSRLAQLFEVDNLLAVLRRLATQTQTRFSARNVRFLAPIDQQEVWAAGVTYLRSKSARMQESASDASAYDRVYQAERPELFFKALPEKVVSPGQPVGIRKDAVWSVPEPELALIYNSKARLVGCTLANDVSARDIEGENLLYLPQAKIYDRSCALGPFIRLAVTEVEARTWRLQMRILRGTRVVFQGEVPINQLKRRFDELAGYLFRSQHFPYGVVLLTGTGIVPPDGFTLQARDEIQISLAAIGRLENPVRLV